VLSQQLGPDQVTKLISEIIDKEEAEVTGKK